MADIEGIARLDTPDTRVQAAGVAARALRDNPSSLTITTDPLVRFDILFGSFQWVFSDGSEAPVGAVRSGCVVGVAGASPPGHCAGFLLPPETRQLTPPPDDAPANDRYFHQISMMAAHDLDEPHWHVGPVGIEPGFQSMGLGRAVMDALCRQLDEHEEPAWLETDKLENVRFYNALGFEVAWETTILSTPVWYMRRPPAAAIPPPRRPGRTRESAG